MKYYSTRGKNAPVSFAKAALSGLAPDGGLFVPEQIPSYAPAVLRSFSQVSFLDLAFETVRPYVADDIPPAALRDMVEAAFNFACPLVPLAPDTFALELFHGPTAAFKDFGARFMARAFSYLRRGEARPLTILTATSGDTGGAVASGFFGVAGIDVVVLYPKGRVSALQERQIAGLGGNIAALAVEGSFDDCQRLVKTAFGSRDLSARLSLSSANSINIARLIPQAVYHARAASLEPGAVFSVPSGNFGNLTAGLYAQKMGAPVHSFIAAVNANRTFADYLEGGEWRPRESVATISSAMDVGNPSNFERMSCHWTRGELAANVAAYSVSDEEARQAIRDVKKRFGYTLDPHGAVGWEALRRAREAGAASGKKAAVLETAHPAKFAAEVEPLAGSVPVPASLEAALARTAKAPVIPAQFEALADMLETRKQ